MSTALIPPTFTAPPASAARANLIPPAGLFSTREARSDRSFSIDPTFERVYRAAKDAADGGLLLFADHLGFVAYLEDADCIGEALGVCVTTRLDAVGNSHRSIRLGKEHLKRNLKLAAASGYPDVWIVAEDRSVFPYSEAVLDEWDHFVIEQLNGRVH